MLPGLVPIGRSAPVFGGSGSDLRGDGGPGERWLDPRRSGLERRGVIGKDRGMIELATPRLVLRGWREDDLNALAAVNADPEVMRFIGDGSVRDREQTAAGLAMMEREWAERGFGIFAVEVRDTGQLAGWVGLAVPAFLPEVLPAVEIGWRLGRVFWGGGIATEGARAVLRFGFVDRGLDRIISIRHVDNRASGRVMEKLGMHFDRRTVVPSHGQPVEVYAISRSEYLAGELAVTSGPRFSVRGS
jgi:RimJ/RimL family protein N-acetyltransferase